MSILVEMFACNTIICFKNSRLNFNIISYSTDFQHYRLTHLKIFKKIFTRHGLLSMLRNKGIPNQRGGQYVN